MESKNSKKTDKIEEQVKNLPSRPKKSENFAKKFNQVTLHTNHFKINLKKNNYVISNYSVEIEPEVAQDAKWHIKKIFNYANKDIEAVLGHNYVQSGWNVFAPKVQDDFHEFKCKVGDKDYKIFLKRTEDINLDYSYFEEGTSNPHVQIFNSKVKKMMKNMNYMEYGQNAKFYDPASKTKNQVKLKDVIQIIMALITLFQSSLFVWQGFKTSVNICQSKIYLQIDFTSRIIRSETVLDVLKQYRDNKDAKEFLVGKSVISEYSHRTYRINDIDFTDSPQAKMSQDDDKTYLEYYLEKYGLKIKHAKQPLIIYKDKKTKKECRLIPELMMMTGLTDDMKSNFKTMKDVANWTKLNPQERMKKISDHGNKLSIESKKDDIEIEQNPAKINGYVLREPKIKVKDKQVQMKNGLFSLTSSVEKTEKLKNWCLIYHKKDRDIADEFFDVLADQGDKIGITVEEPGFVEINDLNPLKWISELQNDIENNGAPSICVSIVPRGKEKIIYPKLKEFFFKKEGIPHQNVKSTTIFDKKNLQAKCFKILLQINTKVGNPLWKLERPNFLSKNTMLIGIDVFHKTMQNQKSCAAFVASLDSDFTQYYSRVLMQSIGQEMIHEIQSMLRGALEAYNKRNKRYPDQIIVYRDGVGQGQIRYIQSLEIQGMLNLLKEESINSKLAYILVNKRINHKFFKEFKNELNNPDSGTIVADEITTKAHEFFLVAQRVTQGTTTPTYYHVVYNTTNLKEDEFWTLTFEQCFNYYNWTGPVRVPAACMYAHKLAYLVGENFKSQTDKKLNEQLFYL